MKLCLLGIHTTVKDLFVKKIDEDIEYKTLVRQCMKCKKVINKPNFNNIYEEGPFPPSY